MIASYIYWRHSTLQVHFKRLNTAVLLKSALELPNTKRNWLGTMILSWIGIGIMTESGNVSALICIWFKFCGTNIKWKQMKRDDRFLILSLGSLSWTWKRWMKNAELKMIVTKQRDNKTYF